STRASPAPTAARARFDTVPTSREALGKLFGRHRPAVVVIEACALAGWVANTVSARRAAEVVLTLGGMARPSRRPSAGWDSTSGVRPTSLTQITSVESQAAGGVRLGHAALERLGAGGLPAPQPGQGREEADARHGLDTHAPAGIHVSPAEQVSRRPAPP